MFPCSPPPPLPALQYGLRINQDSWGYEDDSSLALILRNQSTPSGRRHLLPSASTYPLPAQPALGFSVSEQRDEHLYIQPGTCLGCLQVSHPFLTTLYPPLQTVDLPRPSDLSCIPALGPGSYFPVKYTILAHVPLPLLLFLCSWAMFSCVPSQSTASVRVP